ncbi:bacteriophage gp29 protein [Caballeronia cordobensis]|uniref:Bacteriophage gp29 protein n=1 Tax=Caballeronia cordobensis TaxID=1353886 RepID=A0A158GD44_CABCO|nr:PAAR domain-containing protein [Caballeronia cordobensis]SAL29771.1 bacteriophage gp29 protein [Caballeronia cordobensis]
MTDRLVGKGDWTTTRGRVLGGSSTFFAENGQTLSRRNDIATCGDCEGSFPILGTAETILDEGLPLVRHMDRVLCPCGQNRVLSGHPDFLIRDGKGEGTRASTGGGAPIAAPTKHAGSEVKHTSWFYVQDSVTGEPLRNQRYVARVAGVEQFGKTDANGYAKIETDGVSTIDVHVSFSSPKRQLNPGRGV